MEPKDKSRLIRLVFFKLMLIGDLENLGSDFNPPQTRTTAADLIVIIDYR